jgi:hypothetical protein
MHERFDQIVNLYQEPIPDITEYSPQTSRYFVPNCIYIDNIPLILDIARRVATFDQITSRLSFRPMQLLHVLMHAKSCHMPVSFANYPSHDLLKLTDGNNLAVEMSSLRKHFQIAPLLIPNRRQMWYSLEGELTRIGPMYTAIESNVGEYLVTLDYLLNQLVTTPKTECISLSKLETYLLVRLLEANNANEKVHETELVEDTFKQSENVSKNIQMYIASLNMKLEEFSINRTRNGSYFLIPWKYG